MKKLITTTFLTFLLSSCCPVENKYPDCNSSDIEMLDSCLLGQTLQTAITKLKADTSQFLIIEEPPGILRGLKIEQGDTCEISLIVDRTCIIGKPYLCCRKEYLYIADSTIIALSWKMKNKLKAKSFSLINKTTR